LLHGRGVERNINEAELWLRRAAQAGAEAAAQVGHLCARGGERPPNYTQAGADRASAQRWFWQASERGHPYAQLMLARYLAHGLAGSTDLQEAQRLLKAAEAAGVTQARLDLERLSRSDAA